MNKFYKKNKGFNLISLLVVMLIIAVLVLLAIPKYQSNIKTANRTKLLHDGKVLQDACYLYNMDHEGSDKPWPILDEISVGDLSGVVVNLKGEEVGLASSDNYYPIDVEALKPYISKLSSDLSHYVLKLPVGDVLVIGVESNSPEIIKHRDPESDEIEIWTAEQLMSICDFAIRDEEDDSKLKWPENAKYIQMVDIDLLNHGEWTSVGGFVGPPFEGEYDGNGYSISNINSGNEGYNFKGIFGVVIGGKLVNINLKNIDISNSECSLVNYCDGAVISHCSGSGVVENPSGCAAGLIAQAVNSNISYCTFNGDVKGSSNGNVGGLMAQGYDTDLNNCYVVGTVSPVYTSGQHAGATGGLVGWNWGGCISECYFKGSVYGEGDTTGGLAGGFKGMEMVNCYVEGDLQGVMNSSGAKIGGLVGESYDSGDAGQIKNCYYKGNITADGIEYVGGLVGDSRHDIVNCYSEGTILSKWYPYSTAVGGLIGDVVLGDVEYCYSSMDIEGLSWAYMGGLIGTHYSGHNVKHCYATGNVVNNWGDKSSSGKDILVGGLFGCCMANLDCCYSTGNVSVLGTNITYVKGVGGLAGSAESNKLTVKNCYATGDVVVPQGVEGCIGGLLGYRWDCSVDNCYAVGNVVGYGEDVGGLIGYDKGGSGDVVSSYWNIDTSGQVYSAGGTGLTEVQMKDIDSYIGWDFDNVWGIEQSVSYPYILGIM